MDEEDILMDKEAIMKMAKEQGISYDEMVALLEYEKNKDEDEDEDSKDSFSRSELDRRISQAVETNSKRIKQELEAQKLEEIEKAKSEAEDYAKMSEREKQEAEMKKRIEELEERETQIQRKELRAQISTDLHEQNLPTTLADALIPLGDNEKIKEAIKSMKNSVDEQVKLAVEERLSGDVPPQGGGGLPDDPFTQRIKKIRGR